MQKPDPAPPAGPVTSARDRVPFLQKVAIGLGEIPSIGRQGIEQLALPIYNITLGVNPMLITLVLSLARFWDAIMHAVAGTVSDNTRSRFGRRRPYVLAGAIVCGLTLPAIWLMPPDLSETGYFVFFLVTVFVYFTAYSFFDVPLAALAMEATPDYHERTRVAAYKSFFVQLMGIASAWLFAITQLDSFDGTLQGARFTGVTMGVMVMVFGMIPALTIREGYRKLSAVRKGLPFYQGIRATFLNRPFVLLCGIAAGNGICGNMVGALGLYITVYHVYDGDLKAAAWLSGLWGTVFQLSTIAALPLVTWLSTRIGKIRTLQLCLAILLVGAVSKWFTYGPEWPHLVLVTAVLLGPGQTAFYTIIRSMVADICDYDELETGLRREGMYASMQAWVDKAMGSLATVLSGLVLVVVGFDQSAGGHQAPDTLFYMRLAFVAIPVIGVTIALVALRFFPLNEERMREIRRELETRRGAV
ncbi:MAG: MFS transporter [Opitutaceae bacterium]|nr:MFS transporter [Opitutaceae bacterium]